MERRFVFIFFFFNHNNKTGTKATCDYDSSSRESILAYARKLKGMTIGDVLALLPRSGFCNPRRKGGLGDLIEENYFGFKNNDSSEPDFPGAKLELKSTPYEITTDGRKVAGERLSLGMIGFDRPIEYSLYKSHLWKKCENLLLLYYFRKDGLSPEDYRIDYVKLFTPSEADLKIIEADYARISRLIRQGKAHLLSEGLTDYLGAAPKNQGHGKKVLQYYANEFGDRILAQKRGFCYKQSYMTYVLNHYILGNAEVAEPILKKRHLMAKKSVSIERTTKELIGRYIGETDKKLARRFGISFDKCPKNFWSCIVMRMLGVKSDCAQEFEKAGIVVKVIRIEEDGRIKQSVSFPALRLKSIVEETWRTSDVYQQFSHDRYLFVVFKKENGKYALRGAQFWRMPEDDLNGPVRKFWLAVRKVLRSGVSLEKKYRPDGSSFVTNTLPGMADNPIVHLRPHASRAYYKLHDGTEIGCSKYGDELPDGQWMTKQSVWLRNDYVLSQLKKRLRT